MDYIFPYYIYNYEHKKCRGPLAAFDVSMA